MSEAPQDVRIVIDGREYPCDVLRDPDQDENGCAAWIAVPREPLPAVFEAGSLRAGVLPAKTLIVVESRAGEP